MAKPPKSFSFYENTPEAFLTGRQQQQQPPPLPPPPPPSPPPSPLPPPPSSSSSSLASASSSSASSLSSSKWSTSFSSSSSSSSCPSSSSSSLPSSSSGTTNRGKEGVLEGIVKALNKETADEAKSIQDLRASLAEKQSELTKLKADSEQASRASSSKIRGLNDEIAEKDRAIMQGKREAAGNRRAIGNLKRKLDASQKEVADKDKNNQDLRASLAEKQSELTKSMEDSEQARQVASSKIQRLNNQLAEKDMKIQQGKREAAGNQRTIGKLKSQMASQKNKELNCEKKDLQRNLDATCEENGDRRASSERELIESRQRYDALRAARDEECRAAKGKLKASRRINVLFAGTIAILFIAILMK